MLMFLSKMLKAHLQASLIWRFSRGWYPRTLVIRGEAEWEEKERGGFVMADGWGMYALVYS